MKKNMAVFQQNIIDKIEAVPGGSGTEEITKDVSNQGHLVTRTAIRDRTNADAFAAIEVQLTSGINNVIEGVLGDYHHDKLCSVITKGRVYIQANDVFRPTHHIGLPVLSHRILKKCLADTGRQPIAGDIYQVVGSVLYKVNRLLDLPNISTVISVSTGDGIIYAHHDAAFNAAQDTEDYIIVANTISSGITKERSSGTAIGSCTKGDVFQFDGSYWIGKGNITSLADVPRDLDDIRAGPGISAIVDGVGNDIHIVTVTEATGDTFSSYSFGEILGGGYSEKIGNYYLVDINFPDE